MPTRLLAVVAVVVALDGPATGQEFLYESNQTDDRGCHRIEAPRRTEPHLVRVSVAAPPGPYLLLDLKEIQSDGLNIPLDRASDITGSLEAAIWPTDPSRSVFACVFSEDGSVVPYTIRARLVRHRQTPTPVHVYDDELYRHLIFDGLEDPGGLARAMSLVRAADPSPKVFG